MFPSLALVGVGANAAGSVGPKNQTQAQPVAGGRSLFVDAESGDDNHDGLSESRAWQTLEKVNQAELRPGDRVLFRAGQRWTGQLKPQGEGGLVEGDTIVPLVFDRYGEGPSPRIDAQGQFQYAVHIQNMQAVELRNLTVTNLGPEMEARRYGVAVTLEDYGVGKHFVLSHLHIHDVNGHLQKRHGAGGAIYFNAYGETTPTRFDGFLIENCLLQRCTRNGIIQEGHWMRTNWFASTNVVIRGNLLEQIPGDGIVPIGSDGALIEYNTMRDCPRLLLRGDWAAGIWPWSCDNTVIQFNEVSDHKAPGDGQGFDADWNCQNTLIQNNYSHDNEGGFLLVCSQGSKPAHENIGNINAIARFNISINDGERPYPFRGDNYSSPLIHLTGNCTDTLIHNNLMMTLPKAIPGIHRQTIKFDNWGGPWPERTRIFNNVLLAYDETDWRAGEATDTQWMHNHFAGPFVGFPEGQGNRFSQRTEAGFEAPTFLAASKREELMGFRPAEGSPLREPGQALSNANEQDFAGQPITNRQAPWIGPFQA